mmetsp:Transcript_101230/g.179821  ORF Transcript_101230/g.179821 Transcript_101230/m.179821 type:complete len:382 (-) Transcript_101230:490-1635(-)
MTRRQSKRWPSARKRGAAVQILRSLAAQALGSLPDRLLRELCILVCQLLCHLCRRGILHRLAFRHLQFSISPAWPTQGCLRSSHCHRNTAVSQCMAAGTTSTAVSRLSMVASQAVFQLVQPWAAMLAQLQVPLVQTRMHQACPRLRQLQHHRHCFVTLEATLLQPTLVLLAMLQQLLQQLRSRLQDILLRSLRATWASKATVLASLPTSPASRHMPPASRQPMPLGSRLTKPQLPQPVVPGSHLVMAPSCTATHLRRSLPDMEHLQGMELTRSRPRPTRPTQLLPTQLLDTDSDRAHQALPPTITSSSQLPRALVLLPMEATQPQEPLRCSHCSTISSPSCQLLILPVHRTTALWQLQTCQLIRQGRCSHNTRSTKRSLRR